VQDPITIRLGTLVSKRPVCVAIRIAGYIPPAAGDLADECMYWVTVRFVWVRLSDDL
jgi:hypothetical protein